MVLYALEDQYLLCQEILIYTFKKQSKNKNTITAEPGHETLKIKFLKFLFKMNNGSLSNIWDVDIT